MTTTRERLAAIDRLAAETGKGRREILAALAPTWKLEFGERVAIESAILNTPTPPTPAEQAEAAQHAAKVRETFEQHRVQQGAADLDLYRRYQAAQTANPFHAAQLMNGNAAAIYRGKALAAADITNNEEPTPPRAA